MERSRCCQSPGRGDAGPSRLRGRGGDRRVPDRPGRGRAGRLGRRPAGHAGLELVSVSSAGVQGDQDSQRPSMSADGRYVAFGSLAANLVPDDTNFSSDIFVHDRRTGRTQRISVSAAGVEGDRDSGLLNGMGGPSISADGRFVAFDSEATNLVPGDTNGTSDVFVKDRLTGSTRTGQRRHRRRSGVGHGAHHQRRRPVRGIPIVRRQDRARRQLLLRRLPARPPHRRDRADQPGARRIRRQRHVHVHPAAQRERPVRLLHLLRDQPRPGRSGQRWRGRVPLRPPHPHDDRDHEHARLGGAVRPQPRHRGRDQPERPLPDLHHGRRRVRRPDTNGFSEDAWLVDRLTGRYRLVGRERRR